MPKKEGYYAVARGRRPGVYTSWAVTQPLIAGFSNAAYGKFSTREAADQFILDHGFTSMSIGTQQVDPEDSVSVAIPSSATLGAQAATARPAYLRSATPRTAGLSIAAPSGTLPTNANRLFQGKGESDGKGKGKGDESLVNSPGAAKPKPESTETTDLKQGDAGGKSTKGLGGGKNKSAAWKRGQGNNRPKSNAVSSTRVTLEVKSITAI
ncbi:hypothetical protein B0H63DRAFT_449970 [Podospora didyma]|uniref:Ribonuclease H n=1 Tax=Podospora didyma TaxID=330526 RepID=A0AAE0U048_9PEZI|nr:hypothetical protein B0H63DRAFT_449970 [Podospora didyma]